MEQRRRAQRRRFTNRLPSRSPVRTEPPEHWVRQEITIEPLDRDELFGIWPVVRGAHDQRVLYDSRQGRLRRDGAASAQRFTYALGTTAFLDGQLTPLAPCDEPGVGQPDGDRPTDLRPLLQIPWAKVPRLAALARQWIDEGDLELDDRYGRALLLEQRLNRGDQFQYSLEGPSRDRNLDPIEDFVANHPRGHCEYFATTLALMLRSQGIPARVVLGFRCDEWNTLGKFYQVRQSDAHSWVEAYLAPRYVPRKLRWGDDPQRWAGGAWLRLDPTPAASQQAGNSAMSRLQQGLNWIDSLWANYVMEMDRQRQNEAVYRPLVTTIRTTVRNLCSAEWWRGKLHGLANLLNLSRWDGIGGWLLHVGLPLALILSLAGWIGFGLWRRPERFWGRLAGRAASPARRARPRVEFYRRFEVLLARKGLVRGAGQTPREFARLAAATIVGPAGRQDLAAAADRIVDAFYRVRFGGLPLDNPRREAVEHGLVEWEHAAFPRDGSRH